MNQTRAFSFSHGFFAKPELERENENKELIREREDEGFVLLFLGLLQSASKDRKRVTVFSVWKSSSEVKKKKADN